MASATSARYIELAKALHPRLQRFFAKYPPNQILPSTKQTNTEAAASAAAAAAPGHVASAANSPPVNPFLPHKHPITGRWHDPEFSLRRQAELVKLAREEGVEELLPFTVKGTEERVRSRVELGLRVRGTGVGQKVKGHLYERMLAAKYVTTTTTAITMAALIMRMTRGERREEENLGLANVRKSLQDGEEENSYAGDAEDGQGMAEDGEEQVDKVSTIKDLFSGGIGWGHLNDSKMNSSRIRESNKTSR
ncbi:hypothetical protein SLS62_005259 [Diatrype stigma]|uniref:Large ribosomal subunit protein mL59 domain-containing protein n=1 Tax=Diatrype stigma TaxID=117547 RepID=A0AAN9USZ4_9PEZI